MMFLFLFGFLTKFHLHFIDIHRYVSPVSEPITFASEVSES